MSSHLPYFNQEENSPVLERTYTCVCVECGNRASIEESRMYLKKLCLQCRLNQMQEMENFINIKVDTLQKHKISVLKRKIERAKLSQSIKERRANGEIIKLEYLDKEEQQFVLAGRARRAADMLKNVKEERQKQQYRQREMKREQKVQESKVVRKLIQENEENKE